MTQEIVFTNQYPNYDLELPKPSSAYLPSWYKEMDSYRGGVKKPTSDNVNAGTVKKCMPVFDAITAGYMIALPVDVYVEPTEEGPLYRWAGLDAIQFHPVEQASTHPLVNGFPYPKFMSPWGIKTPKGYSTLFVQPFHQDLPFTIMAGVVDTDTYTVPVNFPFVLNDTNFEGMIPMGTPIAQVIPFKRDSWTSRIGTDKEREKLGRAQLKNTLTFFDTYKKFLWTKKEFK